jgi:hypothetical protein
MKKRDLPKILRWWEHPVVMMRITYGVLDAEGSELTVATWSIGTSVEDAYEKWASRPANRDAIQPRFDILVSRDATDFGHHLNPKFIGAHEKKAFNHHHHENHPSED